ncbi:MAG: hypothetical protein HYS12_25440 [Planctomycetes bacterium]|nr:hypothetical protein [Planctomycetota bacterium]
MSQYVLTQTEAKVLSAVHDGTEETVPQVTVMTLLLPLQVETAISRLTEKGLAKLSEDRQLLRLTEEGQRTRDFLKHEPSSITLRSEEVLGVGGAAVGAGMGAFVGGPVGATVGAALGGLVGYFIRAVSGNVSSPPESKRVMIVPDDDEFERLSEPTDKELARQQEPPAEPEQGR